MKCFGISGTEMPNFDWENKDTVMAFYVTAEMKSVASWLCARHEVLGKQGINTGKSSKLYKIKMSEIS